MPNAGHQARLEAGAQRTLEAIACTPWLGPYAAAQPFNGKELLSVSGLPLIPSWEEFLGRRMSSPNLVHYFSNEKPVR
jgi:hypothetical protein